MLLTLTVTGVDAGDLGYALHKHPDRVQTFEVSAGTAWVFYPEIAPDRCTAALLLEVDPVRLVRAARTAADYVDDRAYAASSLLAVAIGKVFGSALHGRCDARPELVGRRWALSVRLPAVRGDEALVQRLFAPLGWDVTVRTPPRDPAVPEWGDSPFVDITLTGDQLLADALSHLYVLLPVLDGAKHYWVDADEVDKVLRAGGAWLGAHPDRDLILTRALAHRRTLVTDATARLVGLDEDGADAMMDASDTADGVAPSATDTPGHAPGAFGHKGSDASEVASTDAADVGGTAGDGVGTRAGGRTGSGGTGAAGATARPDPDDDRPTLAALRRRAILDVLREVGAHRVVDLGCGEGRLLAPLLADPWFTAVVGVDVSARALAAADRRLRLDRMPDAVRARLELRQGSAVYRDEALGGYDAIVVSEVVEHVEPDRLGSFATAVLGVRVPAVVLTTPNAEFNARYDLPAGAVRHPDHRFEWTRAELAAWADATATRFGYDVELRGIGEADPDLGAPTQLALFRRREVAA